MWISRHIDCMMIGAMGAIMYHRKTDWFCKLCGHPVVAIIAWILFFTSGLYANYIPSPLRNEYIKLRDIYNIYIMCAGVGNDHVLTPTYLQLDSLSILSR